MPGFIPGVKGYDEAYFMHLAPRVDHNFLGAINVEIDKDKGTTLAFQVAHINNILR